MLESSQSGLRDLGLRCLGLGLFPLQKGRDARSTIPKIRIRVSHGRSSIKSIMVQGESYLDGLRDEPPNILVGELAPGPAQLVDDEVGHHAVDAQGC